VSRGWGLSFVRDGAGAVLNQGARRQSAGGTGTMMGLSSCDAAHAAGLHTISPRS